MGKLPVMNEVAMRTKGENNIKFGRNTALHSTARMVSPLMSKVKRLTFLGDVMPVGFGTGGCQNEDF
jgi:hypothetical protein